jgi:hypothetical protein
MKKWLLSIIAGIAGAGAGLWFSENYMHARLFLGGIEVDLSDPAAVEWALANPTKSEWLTYLVFGQDIVMVQPGSYWMTAAPVAFAVILFSIIFFLAHLFARREPEPETPFQKAPASRGTARIRKAARLTGESSSSAPSMTREKPKPEVAGEPLAAVNGRLVKLNGSTDLEAEESRDVAQETHQNPEPEAQQEAARSAQHEAQPEPRREAAQESPQMVEPERQGEGASEARRSEESEETVRIVQEQVAETPNEPAEEPTGQDTGQDTVQEAVQEARQDAGEEIRVEQPAPEAAKPPEGNPDTLEDEVWKTHYDYLDSVRMIFDKLNARGEHMAVDFATRYMVDPKGSDLEAIVAQILEEERQRNRFSDNDDIEAAYVAMMEYSDAAAAEFRRVIRILGEDVDLNSITQKIRQRFPKTGRRSGFDPYQMNESQVITELRGRGFEIIAPAGGPYSVKDGLGSRVTKPFNLLELQEFLKEQRTA